MGWGSAFVDGLAVQNRHPRYLLESVTVPSDLPPYGGTLNLSSFRVDGYTPTLATQGGSVTAGTLRLRDWTYQAATMSIPVLGDLADFRRYTQRGQVLAFRVGFNDDPATFQTVFLGTMVNVRRSSTGQWAIMLRELSYALTARLTATAGESGLFHDLGSTTTTDSPTAYTVGDPTLNVTSTAAFRDDGQGTGAIKVTDSASGNSFYLTYTGTSGGTQFTGLSATGQFETTAINCQGSPASTVEEVAYSTEHPLELARRVLQSTGTGNNGTDADLFPASWGYAIPKDHVNTNDLKYFIGTASPSSGADDVELVVDAEQENGKSWIDTFLRPGGFFLCQVQGQISGRCPVRPYTDQTPGHLVVTPDDVIGQPRYDMFEPDAPVEYSTIDVVDAGGGSSSTSGDLDALPGAGTKTYTLSGVYTGNGNRANIRSEVLNRLGQYVIRTPERITVTLRTWRAAGSAPGDTCEFVWPWFTSRDTTPWSEKKGLITAVSPNWYGDTVTVQMVFLAQDEGEF